MKRGFSISFIGLGQGGCRLAKAFYDKGYESALFINSATVDLDGLPVPEDLKVLIGDGHGAGKDMSASKAFLQEAMEDIEPRLKDLISADKVIVCASSGGGTGSGTVADMCRKLNDLIQSSGSNCRVGSIVSKPAAHEFVSEKIRLNSKKCLEEMCEMVDTGILAPLIVLDNEKLRKSVKVKSLRTFFEDTNAIVCEMIDQFNTKSATPTMFVSLDRSDLAGIFNTAGTIFISSKEITHPRDELLIKKQLDHAIRSGFMIQGDGEITDKDFAVIVNVPSTMLDDQPTLFDSFSNVLNRHLSGISNGNIHRGIYEDESILCPVIYAMSLSKSSPAKAISDMLG